MTALPHTGTVISEDGIQGQFEAEPVEPEGGGSGVWVKFVNGRQLWVAAEQLIPQGEGLYRLPLALLGEAGAGAETQVIPVMTETLAVSKRQVVTGGVRVTKVVREHEELVDEPLWQETVEVQRVPINKLVEAPTAVRYENDTVIVPVLEEVLVVEKRLLLKEEVHIRRRRTTTHQPQRVVRRREEVSVERFQSPDSPEEEEPSK